MAKDTVIVGCKLPNGLNIHIGEQVVNLKGSNTTDLVGGHGITNVDKEFWDKWIDSHRDFAPVAAGLIFANDSFAKTRDEAKEKVENKSGFEGINPENPGDNVKKATEKDDE